MGNSAKRDIRALEQAEKQRAALELRVTGLNHEQIAKELNLSNKSVAWKLCRAGLKAVVREPAEHVLKLELGRLDAMLFGLWEKAKTGDTQSVDRVLRIMDRRAAYLGLDQPKGLKVEMARELEGFLDRLKGAVESDVYERVLSVAAGIDGPPKAGVDPDGADSGDDGDGEEPGGT